MINNFDNLSIKKIIKINKKFNNLFLFILLSTMSYTWFLTDFPTYWAFIS